MAIFPKASHWSYLKPAWHPKAQLGWIDEGYPIEPWIGVEGLSDANWAAIAEGLAEVNRRGLPLRVRVSQPEKHVPVDRWLELAAWRETGAALARSAEWQRLYAVVPDVERLVIVSNNEHTATRALTATQQRELFGALFEGFESALPAWSGRVQWGAWNAIPYAPGKESRAEAVAWDRLSLRHGYDARIGRNPDPFQQVIHWLPIINDRHMSQVELSPWDGVSTYAAEHYTADQWLGMCRFGAWTLQGGRPEREIVVAPWLGWSADREGFADEQWRATMAAVDEVRTNPMLAKFWEIGTPVEATATYEGYRAAYAHVRRIDDSWLVLAVSPKEDKVVTVRAEGMPDQTIFATAAGEWLHIEAEADPAPPPTPTPEPVALIDINSASAAELATLPGIGTTLAQRIIAARPFASVDDLSRVSGIGAATMAGLRGLVEAGPFEWPWRRYEMRTPEGVQQIELREAG